MRNGGGRVQVFELPSVLAYPLFYKLVVPDQALVPSAAVASWVETAGLLTLDPPSRMMEVLAQEGSTAVTQAPPPPPPHPAQPPLFSILWLLTVA